MGWIRERIKAEKRKHHDAPFGQLKRDMDWARIAEGKIVMSIMEWAWKNNTVPYRELHNLDCECGHSLLEHIDMDIKTKSGAGCSNKFCVCPEYKKKDIKSKACIASTDGGWVNCLKLHDHIKGNYDEEENEKV